MILRNFLVYFYIFPFVIFIIELYIVIQLQSYTLFIMDIINNTFANIEEYQNVCKNSKSFEDKLCFLLNFINITEIQSPGKNIYNQFFELSKYLGAVILLLFISLILSLLFLIVQSNKKFQVRIRLIISITFLIILLAIPILLGMIYRNVKPIFDSFQKQCSNIDDIIKLKASPVCILFNFIPFEYNSSFTSSIILSAMSLIFFVIIFIIITIVDLRKKEKKAI